MKKLIAVIVVGLMLGGCGKESKTQAQVVTPPSNKVHNYALKDGYEYGYELELSADDKNKGIAGSTLTMTKFAGKRDGKYQVYRNADDVAEGVVSVLECSNPCDFIKSMIFRYGKNINTSRMRAEPNLLAWVMLEDAINGNLDQFVGEKDGGKYTVWFDGTNGIQTIPVASAKTQ